MESLGEDLVVLSIRPGKAKIGNADKIDFGLMGSELVRLAALGRVSVADERIVVLDAAPTGDPDLDAALRSLTEARRPPEATVWVGKPRRGIRDAYLARLAQAGVIQIEPAKFLGIPHQTAAPSDRRRPGRRGQGPARRDRAVIRAR